MAKFDYASESVHEFKRTLLVRANTHGHSTIELKSGHADGPWSFHTVATWSPATFVVVSEEIWRALLPCEQKALIKSAARHWAAKELE